MEAIALPPVLMRSVKIINNYGWTVRTLCSSYSD